MLTSHWLGKMDFIKIKTFTKHFCVSKAIIKKVRGFIGGPVVKNTSSDAGGSGSILAGGTKIPHDVGQLSLRASTRAQVICMKQ